MERSIENHAQRIAGQNVDQVRAYLKRHGFSESECAEIVAANSRSVGGKMAWDWQAIARTIVSTLKTSTKAKYGSYPRRVEKFHELYRKAKVCKDMDDAIACLTIDDIKVLKDALQVVKDHCGIDMRQEYLQGILKWKVKENDSR